MTMPSAEADSWLVSSFRPIHAAVVVFALAFGAIIALTPAYFPAIFLASLLLLAAIVVRPESSLLLVAFTAPLMNVMICWGNWPGVEWIFDRHMFLAVDFVVPFLLFSIAVGRATGKVEPIPVIKSAIPLFLLVCWGAVTFIWVKDKPGFYTIFAQVVSCAILFYAPIALLRTENMLKAFLWIWLAVGGVMAAIVGMITLYYEFNNVNIAVYDLYPQWPVIKLHLLIFENIKKRIGGLADPNRMAFLMNTAVMGAIVLFMTAKSRPVKLALALPALFVAYSILHTLSKGGVGSLGVTLLLFIWLHPAFNKRRLLAVAALGAIFVGLMMVMSIIDMGGGLGRFGESPVKSRGSSSLALRFKWWEGDMKALMAYDWMGAGLGGLYEPYSYAQSSYFSLLADFGVVGFMIGTWLLLSLFLEMYAMSPKIRESHFHFTASLAFAGCVLIFMIHSVVDFAYNLRVVWIWAGLAVATARLGLKRIEELKGVSRSPI